MSLGSLMVLGGIVILFLSVVTSVIMTIKGKHDRKALYIRLEDEY